MGRQSGRRRRFRRGIAHWPGAGTDIPSSRVDGLFGGGGQTLGGHAGPSRGVVRPEACPASEYGAAAKYQPFELGGGNIRAENVGCKGRKEGGGGGERGGGRVLQGGTEAGEQRTHRVNGERLCSLRHIPFCVYTATHPLCLHLYTLTTCALNTKHNFKPHTFSHTHTHTHTHTRTLTTQHTRTCTHSHTHTRALNHTHTRTCTHTHSQHTHTHTHSHIHTHSQGSLENSVRSNRPPFSDQQKQLPLAQKPEKQVHVCPISMSICLPVCLPICLSLSVCLSVCLFACLFVCLSLSVCLSVCLSLSVYLSVSVCLSVAVSFTHLFIHRPIS